MAPPKCKAPAASKIPQATIDSIKEDSLKKKDEDARKAAAEKITELVNSAGHAEEPMLIDLLEIAITLAGDNKSKNVREAADVAHLTPEEIEAEPGLDWEKYGDS